MKLLQKIKKCLTKNSSSFEYKDKSVYGAFHCNPITGDLKLVFIYKNLRAPIGLISYDYKKLKNLSKEVEEKDGYKIVIKKIYKLLYEDIPGD